MSRPVLTTSRIRLEPMTIRHLPLLVELDADAEVLRYILGRARSAREAQDYWAPICADGDADAVGLGWWVGRTVSDDAFLGWWDLSPARPVPAAPASAEAAGDLRADTGGRDTPPRELALSSSTASPRWVCTRSGRRRWRSTKRAVA
jgi:hypothetical protein